MPESTAAKRVYARESAHDFPIPTDIFEQGVYTQDAPYRIEYQRYDQDDVTPPHYGHTLEVIISLGVKGDYNIDGRPVPLMDDSILFIPPNVLHSGVLRVDRAAYILNLKFDFERLKPTVDIEYLLARQGLSVNMLMACRPDRQRTIAAVQELIDTDADPFRRTAALLRLFGLWAKGMSGSAEIPVSGEGLHKLIAWTEQNYKNRITIDDAARVMHLSRSYFCSMFRQKTGMTYINYLNRLRIERAGRLLLTGMTASQSSQACGFDDLSYFIQLFRRVTGLTTREFVEKYSRGAPETMKRVSY